MDARIVRWSSSTGLWLGALAWATSTQLNYTLVSWMCSNGIRLAPFTAVVLAALSLSGAAISAFAFRHRRERLETQTPHGGTPHEMLAVIGMAAGVLFALIIVMQGTAGFFLTGCEK
jgi:hypothetical protein